MTKKMKTKKAQNLVLGEIIEFNGELVSIERMSVVANMIQFTLLDGTEIAVSPEYKFKSTNMRWKI